MKKLGVILSLLLTVVVLSAQEDPNAYKMQGNDAYKAKDYMTAFTSYAKAIDLLEATEEVDTPLYYNAAYCAYKAKQYEEAAKFFKSAADLDYKESKPYQYLIAIYLKLDDPDSAEEAVMAGMETYPEDAKLKELAGTIYLKKGLVFYNEGNSIKKAANESGLNKTDPEAFKAEYAKADEQYKASLPHIEKAYEYNPGSDKIVQALKNVYISLDMTDKAESL